jgi:hypothetical protein
MENKLKMTFYNTIDDEGRFITYVDKIHGGDVTPDIVIKCAIENLNHDAIKDYDLIFIDTVFTSDPTLFPYRYVRVLKTPEGYSASIVFNPSDKIIKITNDILIKRFEDTISDKMLDDLKHMLDSVRYPHKDLDSLNDDNDNITCFKVVDGGVE